MRDHPGEERRRGTDKGLLNTYASSAIISPREARRLCELQVDSVVMHIDTIHPETYSQVHLVPKTQEAKIQGYRNLLEAGYPPERVQGCLTLSKPVASHLEETVDRFLDEMGASFVIYVILKAAGYGKSLKHFEPGLQEVRRAVEYHFSAMIEQIQPDCISFSRLPDDCRDYAELKEKYGRQVAQAGHVDCPHTLMFGTPQDVREECRRQIEGLARGGGFILASGCEVPPNVPLGNLRAMVEAAQTYGTYR